MKQNNNMMKDFNSINKKMPYQVPPEFFESFPSKVMDKIKERHSFWRSYSKYAIAASIVLTLGLGSWLFFENFVTVKTKNTELVSVFADSVFFSPKHQASAPPIDEVISNMSDEEIDNVLSAVDLEMYY